MCLYFHDFTTIKYEYVHISNLKKYNFLAGDSSGSELRSKKEEDRSYKARQGKEKEGAKAGNSSLRAN